MSDYKNYIARELGIKESAIKPAGISDSDVEPDELSMGVADEKEHTGDEKLAKTIALHHLKQHPDYYSKLKAAGLDEEVPTFGKGAILTPPSALDRIMSPTAIAPQVLGVAVRGSNTGGLPSGRNLTPGKLGGYEPIPTAKNNSELVDHTPANNTINSEEPKADDNALSDGGETHPHQIQTGDGEAPQAITGASEEESPLTLKSAVPQDIEVAEDDEQPEGTDGDAAFDKYHDPNSTGKDIDDDAIPTEKLEEVRKHLSEKAIKGTMNTKETAVFKALTEVLAKRGLGLEQKLFGKKTMLETAKVKTHADTLVDKKIEDTKKKFQVKNLKKKPALKEGRLSHSEILKSWEEDESSGEFIGITDDGNAYYHNKLIVPAKREQLQVGMRWHKSKSPGSPDWDGIKAWCKTHQYFPRVWETNDHGNLSLYDTNGNYLGGLI